MNSNFLYLRHKHWVRRDEFAVGLSADLLVFVRTCVFSPHLNRLMMPLKKGVISPHYEAHFSPHSSAN